MTEQVTQNYRGLKAAVIGMGILLVVGTAALIIGLVRQAQRIGDAFDTEIVGWETVLPAPPGSQVVKISQGGNKLSILVEHAGKQQIIVVDIASGKAVGTLTVAPSENDP